MKPRVVVLGAGFGGLELTTTISEALGDGVELTLIDKSDSFAFGFSKLDVMFGRKRPAEVRMPYADVAKPGVTVLREEVTSIDPSNRVVTTSEGTHEADHLVIALGADYDLDATPGLAECGNEFYSFAGAERAARLIREFGGGRVLIGVCGAPFKCPPAPSEAALLVHDALVEGGVRAGSEITLAMSLPSPVPPSPETSAALLEAFAERDISFRPGVRFTSLDSERKLALVADGDPIPFDLFLAVPKHRAPDVVIASGMTVDDYVPVDSRTLETEFADVYAVGDVAAPGVPKAGVFAEGAARVVAERLIARLRGQSGEAEYGGQGSCYIEFGHGKVGRVDVDFLSGPKPTGTFTAPSEMVVAEKQHFGSSRRARWFS
jgi:sulfide:quinone oxidoreductase